MPTPFGDACWTRTAARRHNSGMTHRSGRLIAICCGLIAGLLIVAGPEFFAGPGHRAAHAFAADTGETGETSAEAILQAHGLKRVGGLWLLPEELQLSERLIALTRFRDRRNIARAYVDQLLDTNEAIFARITKLEEVIKKTHALDSAAKAGSPQRKQLDAELKNEEAIVKQGRMLHTPLDKLGMAPPLKPALVDLVNVQTEATLALLAYRDTHADLPKLYGRLGGDSAVAAALAALPNPGRLGPAKTLGDKWRAMINRLDADLLNDKLPIYREGHAFRFTAIIDESRPLTFTFGKRGEPTVIPQNLAEAAGITAGPHARRAQYHTADGRNVAVEAVRIPEFRLGRTVIKNVEAEILPPEAADVGARIGPNALPGYHLAINAARFQLTITRRKR